MACFKCGDISDDVVLVKCEECNESFCQVCITDHVHVDKDVKRMELVQCIEQLHDALAACVNATLALTAYPNLASSERAIQDEVTGKLVSAIKELKLLDAASVSEVCNGGSCST